MNIIESLLKTNGSSILVSVLLRKDHIKSENFFYSDIFKYERGLTKHDLIPKHELLQRSFIHGNFQTIFTADTFLHCLRIKLPVHLLEIVQKQCRGSIKKAIRPQACNFIKKDALAQVFSCEYFKIFKNTFITEQLQMTASYSLNLSKLASNFLEIFLRSFESRLTFY